MSTFCVCITLKILFEQRLQTTINKTEIDCGEPPSIKNGNFTYLDDHQVLYTCLEGFEESEEDMSIRCENDGNWSPPPLCDGMYKKL